MKMAAVIAPRWMGTTYPRKCLVDYGSLVLGCNDQTLVTVWMAPEANVQTHSNGLRVMTPSLPTLARRKRLAAAITEYIYSWGNNAKRRRLQGRRCRLIKTMRLNSALIEFKGGQREVVDRRALRKIK